MLTTIYLFKMLVFSDLDILLLILNLYLINVTSCVILINLHYQLILKRLPRNIFLKDHNLIACQIKDKCLI